MAYEVYRYEFDVQPIDDVDGTLDKLRLDRTVRTIRKAEDGRELDRGTPEVVASVTIEADKLGDVISELVGWATYYATGTSARDSKKGWHIEGTEK